MTRHRPRTNNDLPLSKRARRDLYEARKAALGPHQLLELATAARVSYSTAWKWLHALRNSPPCELVVTRWNGDA